MFKPDGKKIKGFIPGQPRRNIGLLIAQFDQVLEELIRAIPPAEATARDFESIKAMLFVLQTKVDLAYHDRATELNRQNLSKVLHSKETIAQKVRDGSFTPKEREAFYRLFQLS